LSHPDGATKRSLFIQENACIVSLRLGNDLATRRRCDKHWRQEAGGTIQ
jgi:hypothetical protein